MKLRLSATAPRLRSSVDLFISGFVALCVCFISFAVSAQLPQPTPAAPYRADRILVQPKRAASARAVADFHTVQKSEVLKTFAGIGRLQVIRVPKGETVQSLIATYQRSGLVDFAEPDYAVHASATTPNDPKYLDGTLWGLNNTGQSGGTGDADIDAPEAWDILTSASNIVVAVLDTGVRYTHEDLASNMWVNLIDGSHGWNALTNTDTPNDDNGHGTLVSGILGGVGDNGKGVAGVAWRVQIMACKCLDKDGNGNDSDIIECIDYARTNGARIINASLDSNNFSQALSNAIYAARDAGIIFVASAGNNSANVDLSPRYPACYDIDSIVSVAYTTRTDALGSLSNFGATNVDLAAPGAAMYSCFFSADNSYLGGSFLQGTSFAAPYVAGTFALMLAKYPAETHQQIITRVLSATDPLPALAGKCVTGGRLNLRNALSPPIHLAALFTGNQQPFQFRVTDGPNRTFTIQVSTNLSDTNTASWVSLLTNTTSCAGTFDFTDNQSTNSPQRFYRAVSSP
jgi:subtilisin family serine protease